MGVPLCLAKTTQVRATPALRSRQDSLHTTVLGNTEPGAGLIQVLLEDTAVTVTDFQIQPPKDPSVQLSQAQEPFPFASSEAGDLEKEIPSAILAH